MQNESNNYQGGWISFGILAIIMIGAVIIVWLVSSLIGDRIVPAILGDFLLPAETTTEIEIDNPVDNNSDNDNADTNTNDPNENSHDGDSSSNIDSDETKMPSAPPSSITYTVKEGETLTAIALLHSVKVEDIIELNGITDANLIKPGDVLFIPEK